MAKRVAQGCAEPGKGLGIKGPENNSYELARVQSTLPDQIHTHRNTQSALYTQRRFAIFPLFIYDLL